jgi:hypothetical protein
MTEEIQNLCDEYLVCDKLQRECRDAIKTASSYGHSVVYAMLSKKSAGFYDRMLEIEREVLKLSVGA